MGGEKVEKGWFEVKNGVEGNGKDGWRKSGNGV